MNIPPHHAEIEQIYSQIFLNEKCAVAITSANSNEGVSSLAFALAQRNLISGKSTLLVDLNLYHPSLKQQLDIPGEHNADHQLLPNPKIVTQCNQQQALIGITNPNSKAAILKLRKPGVLENYIRCWQENFDNIIVDCSPINRVNANNIPAERIASACDGCILVVLAGYTSEAMILEAARKLRMNNATLLGCIYNDRDNPALKEELLREIGRLPNSLNHLRNRLRQYIYNNKMLSLKI